MSEKHPKEQIDNYEEDWHKMFYMKGGDGNYIHSCEICRIRYGIDVKRILGGHYLCEKCRKDLRLPKEKTVIKWGKCLENTKEECLRVSHPSESTKKERDGAWKKIIKKDHIIYMFNKNFPNR